MRNGLDAAKFLAMGAQKVGFAKVIMQEALKGTDSLIQKMTLLEYELKVALFCTGCSNISQLQKQNLWSWKNK